MKEYKQKIKLVPYINKQLRAAGIKTDSDSKLAAAITAILQGLSIIPIKNSNSHNYPIGVPIPISGKVRMGNLDKGYGEISTYLYDMSLEQLVPGGNHLRAIDVEVEITVTEDLYVRSLALLRDYIESEMEYISKVNQHLISEDSSREPVTELLREAIIQPNNKLDLVFLSKIFTNLSSNEELQSKKAKYA